VLLCKLFLVLQLCLSNLLLQLSIRVSQRFKLGLGVLELLLKKEKFLPQVTQLLVFVDQSFLQGLDSV
jgi:hypothetical protein